ncbi:MAG: ComF family protein [Planctomycetes bacterium]|nr:ComF family protein [Planctomycetota bacterium]
MDLALPPACVACGAPGAELCDPCRRNLLWRRGPACVRCGEPVLVAGRLCGGRHDELRLITRLVAPLGYAGTGGALVRRFKLDADPAAAGWLLRTMAAAWREAAADGWRRAGLVPVPLHSRRRRERGFDQAAWLVAGLGVRLRLEPLTGVLVRVRHTAPQGDPRVLSRDRNVADAFGLRRASKVRDRRIVLVDDVFTSGATTRACAALLRAAGAREVAVLVACRS